MLTPATLLQFAYKTGDGSKDCSYWQDFVIINSVNVDISAIEDSISSYFESEETEGMQYDDITKIVMNASGYEWHFLNEKPVSIAAIKTIWI